MKMIDLSVAMVHGLPVDPPGQISQITYIDHHQSLEGMLSFFPGVTAEMLPDACGWAVEGVTCTTHSGTHMDAPWHYHPTMNNGEKAWTIDQIPLEWCMGDGVVIDMSHKPDGYICTSDDFQKTLDSIGYTLKKGDIVLLHTSAPRCWGTAEYLGAGCGVSGEATLWLCDHGVRLVGTDAWSWDAPLPSLAKRYKETNDPSCIWEAHKVGRFQAYCHMEKLTNLDKLPPFGFTFIGFPVKLERASAGWVRAVAVIPNIDGYFGKE